MLKLFREKLSKQLLKQVVETFHWKVAETIAETTTKNYAKTFVVTFH